MNYNPFDLSSTPKNLTPPQCPLNILMVTDENGYFTDPVEDGTERCFEYVIDAIQALSGIASINIRTAHRSSMPPYGRCDFPSFRFQYDGTDPSALKNFDQVWLFGISTGESGPVGKEASAIARFMDNGGGVFATGDHINMGAPLCGAIPRVRLMRRWGMDAPRASDMLVPGMGHWPGGRGRHDTRIVTDGTRLEDHDRAGNEYESDDTPQMLNLVMTDLGETPWGFWVPAPHAILRGPHGWIRSLPDHMHEGDCVDVTDPLPAEFHGVPPQLIATAINRAAIPDDLIAYDSVFGAINVYDGTWADHEPGLPSPGRVVVQSTWHHFIHLNLKGFASSNSEAGQAHWANIQAYYRNLAMWLAPPEKRRCMLRNLLWAARWHGPLNELTAGVGPSLQSLAPDIGYTTLVQLGRVVSSGWVEETLLEIIEEAVPGVNVKDIFHPWKPRHRQDSSKAHWGGRELAARVAGMMVTQLCDRFPNFPNNPDDVKALTETFPSFTQKASLVGLESFAVALRNLSADLAAIANKMRESSPLKP